MKMRKDNYHIAMEDLSAFSLERSAECEDWEEISHEELNAVLDTVSEEKAKTFLGVVRNGSFCQLQGWFYRIRPQS